MLILLFRIYITYIKENLQTGEVYVGMASALVDKLDDEAIEKARKRRENAPHHKNKDGFSPAVTDQYSTNKDAIRGREQLLYEKFKKEGIITAQNQPVGNRNPKKSLYIQAAIETFGEILALVYYFG